MSLSLSEIRAPKGLENNSNKVAKKKLQRSVGNFHAMLHDRISCQKAILRNSKEVFDRQNFMPKSKLEK
jgi:hypothetical protein